MLSSLPALCWSTIPKSCNNSILLYGTYISATQIIYEAYCSPVAEDVPLIFSTVQLYAPKMSLTDWAMVSTVWYVPVVVLVTTCVCWYVALVVNIAPFFLQVTVVTGPPVEVQVRDLVVSLYTSVVAVGVPKTPKYHAVDLVFPDVAEFSFLVRLLRIAWITGQVCVEETPQLILYSKKIW